MLVFFAMLAFGLLALAALVIDVGFAIVARRQMQTAVDGAALEGLRGRDTPGDPQRRLNARALVHLVFDDNLDPLDGDTQSVGTGPVLEFRQETDLPVSTSPASETLAVGDPLVYLPWETRWPFQLNPENRVDGDMLTGRFELNPEFDRPAPDNPRIEEDADYDHRVFVPDGSAQASAFLVRMRRTNEGQDQGRSSGPTIPYFFGRGSLLDSEAKARGITVRATAIAAAQRAMSAGVPQPDADPPLPGITPFGLYQSQWDDLPTNGPTSITLAGGTIKADGKELGRFLQPPLPLSLGQEAKESTSGALPAQAFTGYVPIIRAFPRPEPTRQVLRTIGYGLIDVDGVGLVLKKLPSRLASGNASATLAVALPEDIGDDLGSLFREGFLVFSEPLLVPALVR